MITLQQVREATVRVGEQIALIDPEKSPNTYLRIRELWIALRELDTRMGQSALMEL